MDQLLPCKAQWERIAQGLRFHSFEIEGIRATPTIMMRGPEGCLGEVLSRWICWAAGDDRGSEDSATLEALKTAVDKAGFGKVANTLTLYEHSR